MIPQLLLLTMVMTEAAAYPKVEVRRQASTPAQATVLSAAPYVWNEGASSGYKIHSSCNATERAQLLFAFDETAKLAQHAKDHILLYGSSSDFYQTYFGNAKTGEPIGWYEKIVNGEKGGMLWRCDDVDNRCSDPGQCC